MGLQAPATAKIEGETLAVYHSSMFAERGFCSVCGSNIFYRMQDGPELEVSAGLFDGAGMHLSREIFHDSKPPFYAFVGDTNKRTGASMKLEYAPRLIARKVGNIVRHLLHAERSRSPHN